MKVVTWLVEGLYWLNIFIVPIIFLGGAGFVIYHNYPSVWGMVSFVVLGIGSLVLGVFCAERVRRTIGCSVFVNRIFGSPDVSDIQNEKE